MDTRASSETIAFQRPFALRSAKGVQPAGRYIMDLEEETLDGLSFQAWRCTHMTLTRTDGDGLRQALPVTPGELTELRAADGRSTP